MAARAAIALYLAVLAVLVWAGSAQAQDNPACAQYREPMAYNLCLAQHGPKANGVKLHGGPQLGSAAQGRVWYGHTHGRAPTARFYSPQNAHRVHGRVHMEFQVR
jgi:hypothetical protein